MTKEPSLSVIMSCYNEAAVVSRAIESILNQTFKKFEFIIVDDASTDGTSEICQKYASQDIRIRLFVLEKNSGFCAKPLNLAINKAQAPILVRMDADDYSYPNRFDIQYNFLLENPEIDVLGTSVRLINPATKEVIKNCHLPELHDEIVKKRYKQSFVFHPSVMIRLNVFDSVGGYDQNAYRCEDYQLWLKSYKSFRFHNLQNILVDYSVTPSYEIFSDRKWYWSALSIKYQSMKENRELIRYFPELLRFTILYIYHNISNNIRTLLKIN